MSDFLSQMYPTNTQASDETQKLANAEAFAKLAADNNVDLNDFSADQVQEMYNQIFSKTASAPVEEDLTKKASSAIAEIREGQEKIATADMMGRTMARSFWDEMAVIQKEAGEMPPFMQKKDGDEKKDEKKDAPPKDADDKKKEASAAFEALAAKAAIKLAADNGYGDVSALVQSVYNLGGTAAGLGALGQSEKVASAVHRNQGDDFAIQVRGLEYLEKIGMQVNWDSVFGK